MSKRGPSQEQLLGLRRLPCKARRFEVIDAGRSISYNEFRRLAHALSSSSSSKIGRFEAVLARSNDLELARRESGLSGREFEQYRRSFGDRESASPFVKEHGRWIFRGARGFQHAFLDREGKEIRATFSGHSLIAMQDYRSAATERSQAKLDAWNEAHSAGLEDDSGHVHHPETQLPRIDAALRRIGKRQRTRFHQQQFYATA
jgi:hypothetical protein